MLKNIPYFLLPMLLILLSQNVEAQPFTKIQIGLSDLCCGTVAWGDYDSDGDLDIVATGVLDRSPATRIYRNDEGQFKDINAALASVDEVAEWGDYDNDGDLDLLLIGRDENNMEIARLYRNDTGVFTEINSSLMGAVGDSAEWGDYDNDGDLDLIVVGNISFGFARLYENKDNSFREVDTQVGEASDGEISWADYDNDYDLDLIVVGNYTDEIHENLSRSRLYRNEESEFITDEVDLIDLATGTSTWSDYDNDGDLDLLLSGLQFDENESRFISYTRLYNNDEGVFTEAITNLPDLSQSDAAWGDYDNDGDLDLVLIGHDGNSSLANLYRNEGNILSFEMAFTDGDRKAIWGDYDNDGDLDLLITDSRAGSDKSHLFRNDSSIRNQPPSIPTNLHVAEQDARNITLCWDMASDDSTPRQALSYNLRVGVTSRGSEIVSPLAIVGGKHDGQRLIVSYGNSGQITCHKLQKLSPSTTYYASIQALDNSFAGSPFSTELSFTTDNNVASEDAPIVEDGLRIESIYPNPLTTRATIAFDISRPGFFRVSIFDVLGREVAVLEEGYKQIGHHQIGFNGNDLANGVYILNIQADNHKTQKKLFIRL